MSRHLRIGVLVALAFAVSGCGAKDQAAPPPAGSELAPASAPVYIDVSTDPNGAQWKAADKLLKRFPGRDKLLAEAGKELSKDGLDWERDVKPALPEQIHVVWFDFLHGGDDVVGYAKPKDEKKFIQLLGAGSDPLVHRQVDGWTVFTDKEAVLDRFEQARASGERLSDVKSFRNAMSDLPSDAAARGWVGGKAIQDTFERETAGDPSSQQFRSFAKGLGTLEYVTFSAAAEDQGVKLEAAYKSDKEQKVGEFSPELDDALPADALAYVSFGNLEDYLNSLVDSADESFPEFKSQRSSLEKALGFTLKSDLFPLFSKEGAIAVYRGNANPVPNVLFLLRVDEEKARHVIERLAALAEVGGESSTTVTVHGVPATQITIKDAGFSVFAAVADGKAYVTNSRADLERALGDAKKLVDDPVYSEARSAAGAPDETAGFVFVNLRGLLPYIFGFVDVGQTDSISPDVRANTKPVESVFLFAEKDGKRVTLSGFVTIK